MSALDLSVKPTGPSVQYLESKEWLWKGSKLSKNGRMYSLWIDPVTLYEFTTTEALDWQHKRDNESELPGIES